ncbi:uncharacterized protein F5891DRAFT_997768 [Suillus fuscotomentosus]|uniref:Uncharacterized protein n=1 Tax=Suillus fuscotomentosus TaxID=1912939 RepID=A0AAD4EMY8_9AGAM|nr:uncharacterized protein F5891DRAFT_997768 [Suillus fuscotomentosus]KAG1907908.1 hypothetical protein F5891DRAFT_997768 [Suillus fuscotomentosus]
MSASVSLQVVRKARHPPALSSVRLLSLLHKSLLHIQHIDIFNIFIHSTMPPDMQQHTGVPSYDQFRPPSPAKGQRKGKVRSFLPSFVDRAIFRAKPVAHRDTAELHPEVDPATNVDHLATKSQVLPHLKGQLDCTETRKSRTENRVLRTSLVTVNKERKAAPQALDKAQRHSRAVQDHLKVMRSEVPEIIRSYDFNINGLNIRQGAQVTKLQSKLFDQQEQITHLEGFEISSPLVETVSRKTSTRKISSGSQADIGSQGCVLEVQAIAERLSKPQSMEPAVAVKRNSTTKHEPERRGKLIKRQRNIGRDASERCKDDDPFASEPNLAPHRKIRNVLADARDKTLAAISELKDIRRKEDEQQSSQACHGPQIESTAFQDIRRLLADVRESGTRTQATISEMKDARPKKDKQCPSQACHGHEAEFAVYQDQIAALTSERDTLSRELERSTRMANSNAFLLNSVELQAQRLLSEHDALILEHQQEKARSQQQIRELEIRLEETTASASRARERCKAERKQLLEVEEQLKLERTQSAQNHADHLDETLMLFRENAEQANLIETLNRDSAEQRTTLQKVRIRLDLANNAQAIMKRKLQKMELASQQAQENTELLHSTPPKAHGNIIRNLSKPLSQNRPRQVLHPGSPLFTQEIVKNEKVQLPVAATGTSSSSPPEVDGVTSQQAHGKLSSPSINPPVAKPSQRDPLNDNLDISTVSIFSDDGVDLLLEPSEDVIAEGNGLATLYSMLSVVRMYAPSPIRGPPEIQPRRRNVDPLKIMAHPDDMAKSDGVAVGQTWSLFHL